jgi:hypothetical protein
MLEEGPMLGYVILGTLHPDPQDTPTIESPLRNVAAKHAPKLIAEEYPFPGVTSTVARTAAKLGTPYLQIDMDAAEQIKAGIYKELEKCKDFEYGGSFRLSHADGIREEFWLDRIERNLDEGCVLIVCGCHHVHFLAKKAEGRSATVVEKILFPPDLPDGSQLRALSPTELDEEVKRRQHHQAT